MNGFNAFARPAAVGFVAYVRLPKDGEPKPLLGKGGKQQTFPDELTAMKAAVAHLLSYMNGNLVRDGEISQAVAAADSHFKPEIRSKTRGSHGSRWQARRGRAAQ